MTKLQSRMKLSRLSMTPLTLSFMLRLSFFPETMEITTGLWCSLLKGHRSALSTYKGFSMASCISAASTITGDCGKLISSWNSISWSVNILLFRILIRNILHGKKNDIDLNARNCMWVMTPIDSLSRRFC